MYGRRLAAAAGLRSACMDKHWTVKRETAAWKQWNQDCLGIVSADPTLGYNTCQRMSGPLLERMTAGLIGNDRRCWVGSTRCPANAAEVWSYLGESIFQDLQAGGVDGRVSWRRC